MNNLNLQHLGNNSINHAPLKSKPGGTIPFPFTRQGFVVKPLDHPQTLRPGESGNVFPFLVTLQNLYGHGTRKLFVNATVLFDFPHTTLCIYHVWYVKTGGFIAT